MLVLFSITIFLSALLLFWIQLMYGKMILPYLGSTPNVWNTCVVFFQGVLLFGYIYAHLSIKFLGIKKQSILHLALLFLPLFVLPVTVSSSTEPQYEISPVFWLIKLMTLTVGIPFFLVSVNSPMLQKWFSHTLHYRGKDPYFLYVSSNWGSMIGLIGYPFLLEPFFTISKQNLLWHGFYIILVVLIFFCMVCLWSFPVADSLQSQNYSHKDKIPFTSKLMWLLLSMAPSSLMLSVTTYISTDIASVPLLWILPLSIYLISFIFTFSEKQIFSHEMLIKVMPIMILPVMIYILSEQTKAILLTILLHVLTLFVICMVCHGKLARKRPDTKHLTEFYLFISLGGFLGGVFNTLIAPVLFTATAEYPLMLVLSCLLMPGIAVKAKEILRNKIFDILLPILLGLLILILFLIFHVYEIKPDWLSNLLAFGLPALLCYMFAKRPIRFGLAIGIVLLTTSFCVNSKANVLYAKRSFFGVHRIILDSEGKYSAKTNKYLIHGRILHGAQSTDLKYKNTPLTYYYPTGPAGQVFKKFQHDMTKKKIAVIGLGVGSLAAYARSDQNWTFYEIDSVVKEIASNKNHFSFLSDCKAKYNIILGDGRLSIKKAPDNSYDLIVLDAFSSDSIPIHLITKQALELYFKKLSNNGILAFHITNNYLNLKPVLADLAMNLNLQIFCQDDFNLSQEEKSLGKKPSVWIVMARKAKDLSDIPSDKRWNELYGNPERKLWTDDYTNIVSAFKLLL